MNDKYISYQAHEVQNIVAKITAEGIPINERLQVPALIDKFPPSWSNFQVSLNIKRRNES